MSNTQTQMPQAALPGVAVALSPTEKIERLVDAIPKMSARDRDFAASLISQHAKWHRLSDKQWHWVVTLADRADQPVQQDDRPVVKVGDMHGVIKLFETAKTSLKYPKITFNLDGHKVQLALQTKGKWAGYLNITDGRSFNAGNIWYGRVDAKGVWTQCRSEDPQLRKIIELIHEFLLEFSADPAAMAKQHGNYAKFCCFCGSGLSDEHSVAAGFGPVCAKNWGLLTQWKNATKHIAA